MRNGSLAFATRQTRLNHLATVQHSGSISAVYQPTYILFKSHSYSIHTPFSISRASFLPATRYFFLLLFDRCLLALLFASCHHLWPPLWLALCLFYLGCALVEPLNKSFLSPSHSCHISSGIPMHFHVPFLLALLINVAPSDANLLARSTETVLRAHKHAVKRSAGLARDLRLAFNGILVEQNKLGSSRVYCVSSPSDNGSTLTNGTSPNPSSPATFAPNPTSTGSKGSSSSTTSGAAPTGSSSASSPWKLSQNFVSVVHHVVLCVSSHEVL